MEALDIAIKVIAVILAFLCIYLYQKTKRMLDPTKLQLRDENFDVVELTEEDLVNYIKDTIEELDTKKNMIDDWGEDFARLIMEYGSVDDFLNAHKHDFEILRSFILDIYQSNTILRNELIKTARIDNLEDLQVNVDAIAVALDMNLDTMEHFIVEEEKAHAETGKIPEKIKKIKKLYKDVREEMSFNEVKEFMKEEIKNKKKV